jgi:hypothetical protein
MFSRRPRARALAVGGRASRVAVQKDRKRQARRDAHQRLYKEGIGAPASSVVPESWGGGMLAPVVRRSATQRRGRGTLLPGGRSGTGARGSGPQRREPPWWGTERHQGPAHKYTMKPAYRRRFLGLYQGAHGLRE